jgi:hypothetical protein
MELDIRNNGCFHSLYMAREGIDAKITETTSKAGGSCASKKDRVEALKDIRDSGAILDPTSHREKSRELLERAHSYWASLPQDQKAGLPDPKVSSNDSVCGQSCVSYLRLEAAAPHGYTSPQFVSALETARSTKRGRYVPAI